MRAAFVKATIPPQRGDMVFEGIKLIKRKYIILNLALRVINLLMSGWYISLIQTRNNRQRSATDQVGSNLILVRNHKPIRQRLLETYEPIHFSVSWPPTPTQFVSKSPIQKARAVRSKS
jgi:hypothetical protein